MIIKEAYIKKMPNGKYRVMSESGRNMGEFSSKEKAQKRLKQIEFFKYKAKRKAFLENLIIKVAECETFSSMMRTLERDKAMQLLENFKSAFDEAIDSGLENHQEIALMEAKKKLEK